MDKEKYLFRRQYLLGRKVCHVSNNWINLQLNNLFFLTVHPELQITNVCSKSNNLILLGYILDPLDPDSTNDDILKKMANDCCSIESLFHFLNGKGGRYVLIFDVNGIQGIVNDSAAFRQVFYHMDVSGRIFCASSPSLLAEQLNLACNAIIRDELFKLSLFRESGEYWFPGKITLINEVFHLPANHYLNLQSGIVSRFWPVTRVPRKTVTQAVNECSFLLKGMMRAAFNRFNLALAVTGGFDTRVLLAASREFIDKIYFFTHIHPKLDCTGYDITIPQNILSRYDIEHHIVPYRSEMPKEFEALFFRNITGARPKKGLIAFSILEHFIGIKEEMLVVNGVCSEIGRTFYMFPKFLKIDARALSIIARMPGSKTAEVEFGEWLKSSEKALECGLNILDLFYWENRNSNWAAMSYGEYDIAFESFSPFNCRGLLETMLGVDRKYRQPPRYMMHRELILSMWPQLLDYPINPPIKWFQKAKSKLRGTAVYEAIQMLRFIHSSFSVKKN